MNAQEIADFKPTTTYKVTVEKRTTYIKTDGTEYKQIGVYQEADEYNKKGDTKYDYVSKPMFVASKNETVFQQASESTNILALIAAVNGVEFK